MNKTKELEYIITNLSSKVNWYTLSTCKHLTIYLVLKYSGKPWKWELISRNISNIEQWILEHLNLQWDWYSVAYNKSITLKFIEQNLHMGLLWEAISCKLCTNITFVSTHFKHLEKYFRNIFKKINSYYHNNDCVLNRQYRHSE